MTAVRGLGSRTAVSTFLQDSPRKIIDLTSYENPGL